MSEKLLSSNMNPHDPRYRENLTTAMRELAADPATRFVGYGLITGRAMGTLKGVPDGQLIEMPVAENLMVGAAIGMALAGLKPVVFFERFDFVPMAMDAIVNHLNAIPIISRGQFCPKVLIRVVVGNHRKPLHTGHTHTQDFSDAVRKMVTFPVRQLHSAAEILPEYRRAMSNRCSSMLVEYKDYI